MEKIQKTFTATNAQVIEFNYKEYNEYSEKTKKHNLAEFLKKKTGYKLKSCYNWQNVKKWCLSGLNLYVWTRAYRSDFIKEHSLMFSPVRHGEDHLFSHSVTLNADQIYYLNDYLYTYRYRKDSASGKISDDNFCIFQVIEALKEYLIKNNLYEELKEDFNRYQINTLSCHYNNIPEESKEKYELMCSNCLSNKDYKKMLAAAHKRNSLFEFIFSIKNKRKNGIKSKIITIFGIKIEIKPKRKTGR